MLEKKLRKGAQLRLEKLQLEVDEPKGHFETLVASGASYHEIVKAAERGCFDLIVMASPAPRSTKIDQNIAIQE